MENHTASSWVSHSSLPFQMLLGAYISGLGTTFSCLHAVQLMHVNVVQSLTGEWDSQLKWDNPNNFWYGGHRCHIWSYFYCLDSDVSTGLISLISIKFKGVFERCPTWLTCPICLSSTVVILLAQLIIWQNGSKEELTVPSCWLYCEKRHAKSLGWDSWISHFRYRWSKC